MPPPTPDIVQLSKLETQFNPNYTQHRKYVFENKQSRKKVCKEERWKSEKILGHGGFGVVTLEQCIQGDDKGRMRAVKMVKRVDNYQRELEAIALFSHEKYEQCFVKSFGWYDDDDYIYIAMEYLSNGDLQKYLQSPLPESEGQNIIYQILEGLKFMHQHGFAHRDLKPANILVASKQPTLWVKITDFGISKRAIEEITELQTLIGTPAFEAPEVRLRSQGFTQTDPYTNSVDIWSLGIIAFLIFTGETLFKVSGCLDQYVKGTFLFPESTLLAKNISQEACGFIHNLLAPRPEDRPTARGCLQSSWLASFTEPATLQMQRTSYISRQSETHISRESKTQSLYADVQDSASWNTQDQVPSFKPDIKEGGLLPKTSITKSISQTNIEIFWKKRRTLRGHSDWVQSIAFSPDGKVIASGSSDRTIRLWDPATGQSLHMLKGHLQWVLSVAFSSDGKVIASGFDDGTIRLWDPATGQSLHVLKNHS